MIQAFHVYKQYDRESVALSDITLHVEKGEFCFLTGPSGAGKTTFLKLVFREELPSQGQILVGGRNVTAIPPVQIPELRRSIGVVFQDFKLLPDLTVFENVAFVLEAMGVPPRIVQTRVNEVIDLVGLWRRRFLKPMQLSGGERQRVAIARAMANSPSIFLADEPTGNLDLHTSEEIVRLLLSINAAGTTVIVATHDQYLVDAYRQRVVELHDGRLKRDEKRGRYVIDGEL